MHSATVSPVPARPAIGLPSPVPTCPAALLPARSSFHAVPAWAHSEEPYSYPVPARHVLFSLPARSSVLAVPAWAHGEEPYSYPVPARHALCSFSILMGRWPLPSVYTPPPPRWRENPQELETYGLGI